MRPCAVRYGGRRRTYHAYHAYQLQLQGGPRRVPQVELYSSYSNHPNHSNRSKSPNQALRSMLTVLAPLTLEYIFYPILSLYSHSTHFTLPGECKKYMEMSIGTPQFNMTITGSVRYTTPSGPFPTLTTLTPTLALALALTLALAPTLPLTHGQP